MRKSHGFLILSTLIALAGCAQPPLANLPLDTQANFTRQATRFYDTAQDSLTWIEFEARRWDISARLVKVEGGSVDESGRSWDWQYYFTSPFKQNALLVYSNRQSKEVPKLFFGQDIAYRWKVDSDQALELAKKQGLEHFPVWQMDLEDRFDLEWNIRSRDGNFRVNAETGAVTKD